MANVIFTFCLATPNAQHSTQPPLPVGNTARTETIDTTTGSQTSPVLEDENACLVIADADCWVAFGESPDAGEASDGTRAAWFLKASMPSHFFVMPGWTAKVATA